VDGAEELADGRALSIRLRRLLLIEAIKSRAWFKRRPHRAGEIQTREINQFLESNQHD
jgi:hypothetical protein